MNAAPLADKQRTAAVFVQRADWTLRCAGLVLMAARWMNPIEGVDLAISTWKTMEGRTLPWAFQGENQGHIWNTSVDFTPFMDA